MFSCVNVLCITTTTKNITKKKKLNHVTWLVASFSIQTGYYGIESPLLYMWPSIGKPGTTRHPSNFFFFHLRSCQRPDIELSKFYLRSLSRSRYNRPNRSLPSAWNNTFLRNWSIFSRYYARRVVPGFPVDGHIYLIKKLDFILVAWVLEVKINCLTIV